MDIKAIDDLIAENDRKKAEIEAESSALRKLKKKLEKQEAQPTTA